MTVRPGFPAVSGAATFQDIRRSLSGQLAKSAAGVLRTGILPIGTGPLMVGTASMVVNVQTCVVVHDRNGAVYLPNDGVQPVQLSSAPSSGSRWSIVYSKQRETEAPFSDTAAGPLIDKVESTQSETAARNLLPAGARELGVWKIDAGATTTNAASGVTYTETVPYTAMEGGVVLLRNQTEQDAWAPHDGAVAYRLDQQALIVRQGGAWVRPGGVATYSYAVNGLPNSSAVYTDGGLTLDASQTTDSSFVTAVNGSRLTLKRGLYSFVFVARSANAATGRFFVEATKQGVLVSRQAAPTGEDAVGVAGTFYVPADGEVVAFGLFKTTSATNDWAGSIRITRLGY